MEQSVQSALQIANPGTSLWRNPAGWLREMNLSREFYVFFAAAFFFDFGFATYYFLFNLYLLDMHVNERMMGLIGGAMVLGSVVGTLPAGFLARKFGIRALLIVCFISAPILSVLRVLIMYNFAQIGLAFATGLSMCLWGVCFPPAVAGLTTERSRAAAFSLIFSASIGTSALGGLLCGYLPQWLKSAGLNLQPVEVKRIILLASCAIAAIGLFAILRLRLRQTKKGEDARQRATWRPNSFLLRFLPSMALWTAVLAAFNPFANVFLSRELHVPLVRIGVVFSVVQVIQMAMGLLAPLVFRFLGLINGIFATQLATAVTLFCLAGTRNPRLAIGFYLGFSTLQWMSSPGLISLLMSSVADEDRNTASAAMMFSNALLGAASTAIGGALFASHGYPHVLLGIAILATIAAGLFRLLVGGARSVTACNLH